jgi:hypothetical protein
MLPQPAELVAVIHRASSSFDNYLSDSSSTYIFDCRNGNVFLKQYKIWNESTAGVRSLLCSERGMAVVPQFPCSELQYGNIEFFYKIISKEEGNGISYSLEMGR